MGSVAWQVRCAPERAMTLIAERLREAEWREVEQRADDRQADEGRADEGQADDRGDGPRAVRRGDRRRGASGPSCWFERGHLGRSVLLGGLAGGGQYLQMRVEVRSAAAASSRPWPPEVTGEVVCSWSDASPRALGGILGERRARRTMDSTTRDLRSALDAAGVLGPRTH